MIKPGTIDLFAREFEKILEPLKTRIEEGQILTLMAELGIKFPDSLKTDPTFAPALSNLVTNISSLSPLIEDLVAAFNANDYGLAADKTLEITEAIKEIVEDIETVRDAFAAINFSADGISPAQLAAYAGDFIKNLLDYLLINYLEGYSDIAPAILEFWGIIDRTTMNPGSVNPVFPEYVQKKINYSNIPDFIKSPPALLKTLYGWGDNSFDGQAMLEKLGKVLLSAGIPSVYTSVPTELDVFFLSLTPNSVITPPGLTLSLNDAVETGLSTTISGLNWTLQFGIEAEIPESGNIVIPPEGEWKLTPPSGTFSGKIFADWVMNNGTTPLILLGSDGGSNLQAMELTASASVEFEHDPGGFSVGELVVKGAFKEGKIIIKPKNPDGFLAKILPENGMEINLDFRMGISSENGFYIEGSAGLEIQLPVHISIGPIEINSITFAVKIGGGEIPFELGANIQAAFGPVKATVENIGFKVLADFPSDRKGNLGPVNIDLGFKPPKGIGISIDASAVKGGGFLYFDPDNHRYAGVAELTIKDKISLKAIGLITTRLPDGTPKVSFLLIVSAEFPPIQLGFGFTLNGVGGIVGINRTMVLEELRKGVKDNTLDHILFPADPVANAAQLLSDIDRVFPVAEGRYVFGPMGIIGWGTPTLITAEIGLMIEVPDPVRIAILGVIKCVLPDESKQLLKLQVNFLGTIDFEAKFITFDASIYDSKLLSFTLSGDMAVRIKWGDNPNFLFTVGGFHPRYTPPPLSLPTLNRLTLNLLGGDNPRLTLSTYFAVTSNTAQFGSRVDFYYKVTGKIKVLGYLGFDALFQFSPFYFDISFEAGLSVYWKDDPKISITLRVRLEGPTPWHAQGVAEFKICGIKAKVDFDKTWGNNQQSTLPDINVRPLVAAAVDNIGNWTIDRSVTPNQLVTYRQTSATNAADVFIHPDREFGFSQKVAPFDISISRFGNQKPSGAKKFWAELYEVPSSGPIALLSSSAYREDFAPASFFALNNDQKLSRPSFEKYNSGLKARGTDEQKSDFWREGELTYETIVLDTRHKPAPVVITDLDVQVYGALLRNNAAAKSPIGSKAKAKSILAPDAVKVSEQQYAVVDVDDLSVFSSITASSYAEAQDKLEALFVSNPALQNKVQVVSMYEVA